MQNFDIPTKFIKANYGICIDILQQYIKEFADIISAFKNINLKKTNWKKITLDQFAYCLIHQRFLRGDLQSNSGLSTVYMYFLRNDVVHLTKV